MWQSAHLITVLVVGTHLTLHVWVILETILVMMTLATTHWHVLTHLLVLLTISVAHPLLVGSDSLRRVIHFYGASEEVFTIHFLKSSFGLLF